MVPDDWKITREKDGITGPDESYIRGYLYCVAMNEALRGLYGENVNVPELFGVRCTFDLENFYCCLTGLSDRAFSSYGLSPRAYVDLYREIKQMLFNELHSCLYEADIFLETRLTENKIVILFSPQSENCIHPAEMAKHMGDAVQRVYEERLFSGRGRHCNFTVLSEKLSGFAGLQAGYRAVRALSEYAFFFKSPMVVTEKDIELYRKEVDYHSVMVACMEVRLALAKGAKKECMDRLKELFELLKSSLRFSLFRSALAYLEHMLEIYCAVYDTWDDINLKKLCDGDAYDYLEDCLDAFLEAMECIFARAEGKPHYSRVVKEAMYYIKHNFESDISLLDIAKYAEITPSYLSTLFKREVGTPISDYIMDLRIKKAKELLENSDKKVCQIALEVGFHDIKYFGRAFRQRVSVSPAKYRENAKRQGRKKAKSARAEHL